MFINDWQVFWLGSSLPPSRGWPQWRFDSETSIFHGSLTATGIAPEFLTVTGFPLHRDVLPGFVAGCDAGKPVLQK